MSELQKRFQEILDGHVIDSFETCSCEPGYIQGNMHIARLLLNAVVNRLAE